MRLLFNTLALRVFVSRVEEGRDGGEVCRLIPDDLPLIVSPFGEREVAHVASKSIPIFKRLRQIFVQGFREEEAGDP